MLDISNITNIHKDFFASSPIFKINTMFQKLPASILTWELKQVASFHVSVSKITKRPEETEKYLIFITQEQFGGIITNFKTNHLLIYWFHSFLHLCTLSFTMLSMSQNSQNLQRWVQGDWSKINSKRLRRKCYGLVETDIAEFILTLWGETLIPLVRADLFRSSSKQTLPKTSQIAIASPTLLRFRQSS